MDDQPAPPFVAGQRIRCCAHFHAGDAYSRSNLIGRARTVAAVEWRDYGTGWHWVIRLDYDHLGQLTYPQNPITHHRHEDLVPIEDW